MLTYKGIILLTLLILLKIFSLTAKVYPRNLIILLYALEPLCAWLFDIYCMP